MALDVYEQLKAMNMMLTALMQHTGLTEVTVDIGPMLKRGTSRGVIVIPDSTDEGKFCIKLPTQAEELT